MHAIALTHARNFGGARSFLRFRKWFQLFAPVYLVPLACGRSFKTCKKTFPPNLTNAQLIPCMLCALPFRQGNSSLFHGSCPCLFFQFNPTSLHPPNHNFPESSKPDNTYETQPSPLPLKFLLYLGLKAGAVIASHVKRAAACVSGCGCGLRAPRT